ncbi:MAG: hypothetical protein IPG60_07285 [Bacteroidetes bacterium]|nr:hypothetical protein [Bacteroidota bacterium]
MGSNFKEAAEAFKQAVTIEPEFITAYIYGGDAYQQAGLHVEAEEFLEKAIDLQADYDVGVYIKIARSEQMLMKYDEAFEHIQIFLAHPDIVGETKEKQNYC